MMNVEKHARDVLDRLKSRAEPFHPWQKPAAPVIRPVGVVVNRPGKIRSMRREPAECTDWRQLPRQVAGGIETRQEHWATVRARVRLACRDAA
jgi:hypothetical protein